MRDVGLIPSDTGAPGGKEVGQRVSHYIEAGGRFERACADLVNRGFDPLYVELWTEGGEMIRKKKAASKTRYPFLACQTNPWAKPDVISSVVTATRGWCGGRSVIIKYGENAISIASMADIARFVAHQIVQDRLREKG